MQKLEQSELMEKWKTELFQDQALNKLFDQDINQEEFILLILTNYNMVQIGDIFTKLSSINHNICLQLNSYIKNNYQHLLNDIKDDIQNGDKEQVYNKLQEIKSLKDRLDEQYLQKYLKIRKLEPIQSNSQQVLIILKQLQKFQSLIKLLKTLAQQTSNSVNIIDPLRVANVLLDIYKLDPIIQKFQLYQQQIIYLKSVDDSLQLKANRKFSDALQNKSLPELCQCLGIFYSLGKLAEIIETKSNLILKQTAESYKLLLSKELNSKQFIMELKPQVKEDFNNLLQIWLIQQAIQQRDTYNLISYEEYLQEIFPNLFQMVWNKYCDILRQSFKIIIDNQNKFEITRTTIIKYYPSIRDQYSEFSLVFNEQILVFPQSILCNIQMSQYLTTLFDSLSILQKYYFTQFTLKLKDYVSDLANDVFIQEKGITYLEKSLTAMTNFIDFVQAEITQIRYDENSYKLVSNAILVEIKQLINGFEGIKITQELSIVLQLSIPKILCLILDHNLNVQIDILELQELINVIKEFQSKLLFIDCSSISFDTFVQSDIKMRKQNLEIVINQLNKIIQQQ